ncbi:helix-turn-helix domain-containing protein [Roseibium sp.]|uniref:AraC family transcriptional regulator n=1 Tax=Roseibium sp. TaxID=1936156 RepID=UPI003A96DFA4
MKPVKEWARADALRMFRDSAPRDLLDWNSLASEFGISPSLLDDPEAIVPIDLLYALFDRAAQIMDNDAILFDLFHMMDLGNISSFDYLFVCAATIRDGCIAWERFNQIRSNAYHLSYSEDDGFGILEWKYQDRHGPWRQNMFARMGWAVKRIEIALDTPLPPISVEMNSAPPFKTSDLQRRYGNRLKFDRERNAILIPKTMLSVQPVKNDNNLYAIIQRSALEEQENLSHRDSPSSLIANAIAESLKTGTCTLDEVAQTLGMSSRTVQRILEEDGTSFRRLTEEIRRSAATRYLRDTRLPIKEIAFLLGFSEISTFSRAVKNWFGQSPKEYRRTSEA